ncbi:hypothetical protein APR09_003082 [Nocardia amikacinitolerans]|nr:hypothetical protein [Nocardia amikacinitolerans]
MSQIKVDPNVYYNASKSLSGLTTDIQSAVNEIMTPGLNATLGMGGHYAAVKGWNTSYKKHCEDLVGTISAYAAATQQLADVLNLAGHNWHMANYNANSDKNKGPEPNKPSVTNSHPFGSKGIDPIPDPATLSPSASRLTLWPSGSEILLLSNLTLLHVEVPDGDTDTLNRAATGWRRFHDSTAILEAAGKLNGIEGTFSSVEAPDVAEIRELLGVLKKGANAISVVAAGLASAVTSHHDALVDLRSRIIDASPTAFPDHGVKATRRSTGVDVMPQREASETEIYTAANVYKDIIGTHPLLELLRKATFDGVDSLAVKTRLTEIAALRDDAIVRLDSYSAEPVKCTLNPNWESELAKIDPDVRPWVGAAVKYGNEAGVDPRLVLAIVYNEGGNRSDSFLEREMSHAYDTFIREGGNWLRPNSLGLTNIKEDTFNTLKNQYPSEFAGKEWSDLKSDPDLAIMAASYNLKRIETQWVKEAPDELKQKWTLNEFMAAGYNSEANMDAYIKNGDLGPHVQAYVRMTHTSLDKAGKLIGGMYTCK